MAGTRIRPSAVVVVVAAASVLIWLLVRDGDDDKTAPRPSAATPAQAKAVAVSGKKLREAVADLGFPVYWAGRMPNRKVELSRTAAGYVYIRYLPPDTPVGEARPVHLTIGTYPLPDAYAATRNAAAQPGNTSGRVGRDGLVVSGTNATSAYLAYRGGRVQIEVFSPEPGRALQLIRSGRIRAVRP